jgi:hypothetical protein
MGDLLHNHLPLVVGLLILGVPFFLLLWVIPMGLVCKKAGFSPWLTMLNCCPLGALALIYLLAFADWKYNRQRGAEVAHEAPRTLRVKSGPQLVVRPAATRLVASGSGGIRG